MNNWRFIVFLLASIMFLELCSQPRKVNGERLDYTMSYGWFKVGEVSLSVDLERSAWNINQYLIQCRIQTAGLARLLSNLQACIETRVDSITLLPISVLTEVNNSKKAEIKHEKFLHQDSTKILETKEYPSKEVQRKFLSESGAIRDPLSTYIWLRSLNQDDLSIIQSHVYFEGRVYPFKMRALAPTTLKHKGVLDKVLLYELTFPVSSTFPEGKRCKVFVSDDGENIPLQFEIDMNLGKFYFTLKE